MATYATPLTDDQEDILEGEVPLDAPVTGMTEYEDGSVEVEFGGEDVETDAAIESALMDHTANLATALSDDDLATIGAQLQDAIKQDEQDRAEWIDIAKDALTFLGLKDISEDDLPFEGAAMVTHPLLLEAVVKFQSKAYVQLFPSKGPVKTRLVGKADPAKVKQAARVKDYMNYQVQCEIEEYDAETDRLLFYVGLMGTAFTKLYPDPAQGRAAKVALRADEVIVPYHSSGNLAAVPRYTHRYTMDNDTFKLYVREGLFREVEGLTPSDNIPETELQGEIDEQEGKKRPAYDDVNPTWYLDEIYVRYNLPGFEEPGDVGVPYIITMDCDSGTILSIRRNWDEADPLKKPLAYITKYDFIPGLGSYGYGYLHLIGGLSRSATSILRQLIDAGSFATMPAGLKAHGLRVLGNNEPFQPGEWRDVQAPMGDVQKSFFPLPYKEPSATLANLLTFLVTAGEKFADATDQVLGDAKSYGPVGTVMALIESGETMFSAIHKRLHAAQAREFKILARLNYEMLPEEYPYEVDGEQRMIKRQDFDGRVDIVPVSDPNMPSQAHRVGKANAIFSMAVQAPQIHDMRAVMMNLYESLDVEAPERFLAPLPQQAQPLDPVSENTNILNGRPVKAGEWQNHVAHIKAHMNFLELPLIKRNAEAAAALAAHVTEHIAQDYRVQMSKALGMPMPPPDQPMDPQMEAQFSVRVAQATEALLNGEIARLMEEKMQNPETAILFATLEVEKDKNDKNYQLGLLKLIEQAAEKEADMQDEDNDRLVELLRALLTGVQTRTEQKVGAEVDMVKHRMTTAVQMAKEIFANERDKRKVNASKQEK